MPELLTRVDIHFLPDFLNYWLRFGAPVHEEEVDRRRAYAWFAPGQVFGYVRWEANAYGTKDWRFFVVRAGDAAVSLDRIPGVAPGGETLLALHGNARLKKTLAAIDAIETLEIDPADAAPAYFRHVHNRILTRLPIRPYSRDQHRAHLRRSALWA